MSKHKPEDQIEVGSEEYNAAINEFIDSAHKSISDLVLDRKANLKARVLEEALSDLVRESLGGNDMTPLDVMTAMALFMTRGGLAIGGAIIDCDHEECARHKALGLIAAMCKVACERTHIAKRRTETEGPERVTCPGKHGAH